MFKNNFINIILLLFVWCNISICHALEYRGVVSGTDVNLRSGPGTNYEKIKSLTNNNTYKLVSSNKVKSEAGCASGWYEIYYEADKTGFVCSNYLNISLVDGTVLDKYDRPWTTPKKAIIGGAKFISEKYINAGQNTSYLKKFNVNPNALANVYNHQYMANLQAPYSEAYSSYKSYLANNLLTLPLEFTIPVFEQMPEYTVLPGKTYQNECLNEVKDVQFEQLLDEQGFPESYKCKLRLIHETYPNWTFKALQTTLDFHKSVIAEQAVSSIQGGDIYYDLSSGSKIETESGWYKANYETVAYYLDPRNFLIPERILMFENLAYSLNYTEAVVQTILNGTFMEGYSFIDNELYASIFVEAGTLANTSSVYLASLARQESGTNGGRATTGAEFTYQGFTYVGLYNYYNIGASSSAESPVLAGLVWASGGSSDVLVTSPITPPTNDNENIETPDDNDDNNNNFNEETLPVLTESMILNSINATSNNGCLTNLTLGTTLGDIKKKLSNLTVSIEGVNDTDTIKTNQIITFSDGVTSISYTIVVSGDVDGNGVVGATDYVKIKNYIMEKPGSELSVAESLAADVDKNGEIGATDYVLIKKSIMEG